MKSHILKVLVIDDCPDILELLKESLKEYSFSLTFTSHAQRAKDYFQHEKFDLVISDYFLPGKTGLEIIKDFRSLQPQIEVIIFTSESEIMKKIEKSIKDSSGISVVENKNFSRLIKMMINKLDTFKKQL